MERGFAFADGNPDLLRLYVPRAIALIAAFPDRAADFPSPQALRGAAEGGFAADGVSDLPAHLRADLCDGLVALARSLERVLTNAPPAAAMREPVAKPTPRVA
jgi:hypothetical protein